MTETVGVKRRSLMKGIAWTTPSALIVAAAPAYAASQCTLDTADPVDFTVSPAIPQDLDDDWNHPLKMFPLMVVEDITRVDPSDGGSEITGDDAISTLSDTARTDLHIPSGTVVFDSELRIEELDDSWRDLVSSDVVSTDQYSVTIQKTGVDQEMSSQRPELVNVHDYRIVVTTTRDISLSEILSYDMGGSKSSMSLSSDYTSLVSFKTVHYTGVTAQPDPYLYSNNSECKKITLDFNGTALVYSYATIWGS